MLPGSEHTMICSVRPTAHRINLISYREGEHLSARKRRKTEEQNRRTAILKRAEVFLAPIKCVFLLYKNASIVNYVPNFRRAG